MRKKRNKHAGTSFSKFMTKLEKDQKKAKKHFDSHIFFKDGDLKDYSILDIYVQGYLAGIEEKRRKRK